MEKFELLTPLLRGTRNRRILFWSNAFEQNNFFVRTFKLKLFIKLAFDRMNRIFNYKLINFWGNLFYTFKHTFSVGLDPPNQIV
jgi:hypothetical protein